MINLKPEKQKSSGLFEKYRKPVLLLTTLVFVSYIVTISGLTGWWVYWNRKEIVTTAEEVSLQKQINAMVTKEVLYRKQEGRVRDLDRFLGEFVSTASLSGMLVDDSIEVLAWDFDLNTAKQNISVSSRKNADLVKFSDKLANRYSSVVAGPITLDDNGTWEMVVSVKGDKWK